MAGIVRISGTSSGLVGGQANLYKEINLTGLHYNALHCTTLSCTTLNFTISRSEQAPGSGFHPREESEKNYCGFLGPYWCNKQNKQLDPKR